jgi:hypothetical protein
MSATINRTAGFDAVPNHVAMTVSTSRRDGMNRTFETIKCHGLARLRDLKGFVVVVTADNIANCSMTLPFSGWIDFSLIIQAIHSLWLERDSLSLVPRFPQCPF